MKDAISTLLQTGTPNGHPLDALVCASAQLSGRSSTTQTVPHLTRSSW